MLEYAFATVKHGQFADVCNIWAKQGFVVVDFRIAGNSFYVLFSREVDTAKIAADKKKKEAEIDPQE